MEKYNKNSPSNYRPSGEPCKYRPLTEKQRQERLRLYGLSYIGKATTKQLQKLAQLERRQIMAENERRTHSAAFINAFRRI